MKKLVLFLGNWNKTYPKETMSTASKWNGIVLD